VSAIPSHAPGVTRTRFRSLSIALALGRFEGRKLLRHPACVVGAFLSAGIVVVATWPDVPVLNRYDGLVAEGLIPFGVGVLVAAHLATMRARRNRTTELFDSVASPDSAITGAQLVAVAVAVAFAFALSVAELAYMKVIGGVTTPRPQVVLTGPALVGFAGAFGVALGRWAPRLFAAPLGLAGIVAICTALTTNTFAHDREWLSLWVPSEFLTGVSSEMSLRPYGWRLAYFSALAIGLGAIAFTFHRRHRFMALGLASVAIVAAAVAGNREMQPVARDRQAALAEVSFARILDSSCREYVSVRYCAMDGYGSWVDRWRPPVEGVLAAVPSIVRPEDLTVFQLPADQDRFDEHANRVLGRRLAKARRGGTFAPQGAIYPSLTWGRNGSEGTNEFALSLATAVRVTGIDTDFRLTEADVEGVHRARKWGFKAGGRHRYCTGLEQGRSIVALWLAAQATPGAEATLRSVVREEPYLPVKTDDPNRYFTPEQWALDAYLWDTIGGLNITWGTRESTYALQLLDQDEAEVRAAVASGWDRLTDPATTSDQAAAMLGLEPLVPLGTAVDSWKYFRRYRGIEQFGSPPCH
jgi:hypothetical protein